MNDIIHIGFQGIEGAYSQAALRKFLNAHNWELSQIHECFYDDFKSLMEDLLEDHIDFAVIPIENSTTGLITRSLDLFRGQPVIALEELYQEVKHTLWGLPGSSISQLTEVYSHPEALSQCDYFFQKYPHIKPKTYSDTAKSALYIQSEGNPQIASIASPEAGAIYGLEPLLETMQTEETNTTRFFLVRKWDHDEENIGEILVDWQAKHPERTRMLFYITTRHQPGALAKLLNLFHVFDVNLVALDSRPIVDQPFKYGFFIEVDLSTSQMDLATLWQSLLYVCESIQVVAIIEPDIINF